MYPLRDATIMSNYIYLYIFPIFQVRFESDCLPTPLLILQVALQTITPYGLQ